MSSLPGYLRQQIAACENLARIHAGYWRQARKAKRTAKRWTKADEKSLKGQAKMVLKYLAEARKLKAQLRKLK